MLIGIPTRYGAGISLAGDFRDLTGLRASISDLVADAPRQFRGAGEQVAALTYELRKALDGFREPLQVGTPGAEDLTYLSVKSVWPVFLTQIAILRQLAAYCPTTASVQADLYRLEAVTQQALEAYEAQSGKMAWSWVKSGWHFPPDYHWQFLEESALQYATQAASGKKRFRLLPELLRNLSPQSPPYRAFAVRLKKMATESGCSVDSLDCFDDWPDFKW